jgi:uncharacterized protein (DUF427 family)
MPRATRRGGVLAEAPDDAVRLVEGNVYFPPNAVRAEHLSTSDTHPVCGWKGTALSYDVSVVGEVNRDAAWCYPTIKEAAKAVEGWVAFWHGVNVER